MVLERVTSPQYTSTKYTTAKIAVTVLLKHPGRLFPVSFFKLGNIIYKRVSLFIKCRWRRTPGTAFYEGKQINLWYGAPDSHTKYYCFLASKTTIEMHTITTILKGNNVRAFDLMKNKEYVCLLLWMQKHSASPCISRLRGVLHTYIHIQTASCMCFLHLYKSLRCTTTFSTFSLPTFTIDTHIHIWSTATSWIELGGEHG